MLRGMACRLMTVSHRRPRGVFVLRLYAACRRIQSFKALFMRVCQPGPVALK